MDAAPLATRFGSIVATLCRAIAVRGAAKKSNPDQTRFLLLLLWTRLRRAATRFCALAAGAPPPGPRRSKSTEQKTRPRAPDLPRRRGWILVPVPEASCSAGQLRDFLADPEVKELIEAGGAKNRFGRILRPLCRTLGITPPPFLRLPRPQERKTRRKPKRGSKRAKFYTALIMRGPFHPPENPPGLIPQRRTRAPPRPA